MNAAEKYANVSALRPVRKKESPDTRVLEAPAEGDTLATLLGAHIQRNHFGEHLSLKNWYATPEMCSAGVDSVSLLLPHLEDDGASASLSANPEKWLFLDTETTGLAGGTGTHAFLVGIAWWDAGGLQVEQFFMRDLDEEHSLLLALSERMEQRPILVTFNGKSFDWPLLETRYRMTRCLNAFTPKAHLDLLHPARQLWRLRLGSVRLKDLERHVLTAPGGPALDWTRDDDIDSSLIPQMYFDYLRGGPANPLEGIFRHNQMDLRGLAALAARIFALLDSKKDAANTHNECAGDAFETLGLSRLLRRRGHSARAQELYESALRFGLPGTIERFAQRELAQLAKREQDYVRAIPLWKAMRRMPKANTRSDTAQFARDPQKELELAIEATEQIAIYYEHRMKQPLRALELVRAALSDLQELKLSGNLAGEQAERIELRLAHRLKRLERSCIHASLFKRPSSSGKSAGTSE